MKQLSVKTVRIIISGIIGNKATEATGTLCFSVGNQMSQRTVFNTKKLHFFEAAAIKVLEIIVIKSYNKAKSVDMRRMTGLHDNYGTAVKG